MEWLIRNHKDYWDVELDEEALSEYPACDMPFTFTYLQNSNLRGPENVSVNDNEEEIGTTDRSCPYIIHGLIGSDVVNKNWT